MHICLAAPGPKSICITHLSAKCRLHSLRVRRDGIESQGFVHFQSWHKPIKLRDASFERVVSRPPTRLHGLVTRPDVVVQDEWGLRLHCVHEEGKVVSRVAKVLACRPMSSSSAGTLVNATLPMVDPGIYCE